MALEPTVVDHLWELTCRSVAHTPRPIEATYRLQLHAGFTFRDAARITAYLRELGITHCYASPYLRATPGSTHGYDIVDHAKLNPELGSDEDFDAWMQGLADAGLGQFVDVVPNHMGVATNDNIWWNDVLENGPASPFGRYFDIAWHSSPRAEMQNRVLLPVLGQPYGDVLDSGQLRLSFDAGNFVICYGERRFPVAAHSYDTILSHQLNELLAATEPGSPGLLEYQSIITAVRNLPGRSETDPQRVAERAREKEIIKRRLAALAAENVSVREFIEANVAQFNGKNPREGQNGRADRFALMDGLLELQCYRLAYWRVAPDEINYRRFFDVNELAALSMEREEVFEAAHRLVFRLLAAGKIDALRIDHPDGLFDPAQYLTRLQQAFLLARARAIHAERDEFHDQEWTELETPLRERIRSELGTLHERIGWPLLVIAEKILSRNESLPEDWPVQGTTGYECINMINGLFVDADSADSFRRRYEQFITDDTSFAELSYQKKLLILSVSLASELHMLTHQLDRLAQKNRKSRDFTFNTLRRALREVIAFFPVYRTYIADGQVRDDDRRWIEMAVRRASMRNPLLGRRVFRFLRDMLLLEYPATFTEDERAEQRRFIGNFQQVTGPVTAKGLEDTAMYIYNRLVSLNEVGGEPDRFGVSASAFHKFNVGRQERSLLGMAPLSTHDTKRSEDVRARLNVLSEIPDAWWDAIARWREMNAPHRRAIEDLTAPDPNEECLLYQTLLGAWPLDPGSPDEYVAFTKRIQAYMRKALHEAKVHTSWINPNDEYDDAVANFVAEILSNQAFLSDFADMRRLVNHFGLFNSLAQTLLKFTAPGIADTYQGTELWDFSLVDPDNRRPVDFERRSMLLAQLQDAVANGKNISQFARSLVDAKDDGRIKLYVSWRALQVRRAHPKLFTEGAYVPLQTAGQRADHVVAFLRTDTTGAALVAVPRLLTKLCRDMSQPPMGKQMWGDTQVLLPAPGYGIWRNTFTNAGVTTSPDRNGAAQIPAAELFEHFPIALLEQMPQSDGGAE